MKHLALIIEDDPDLSIIFATSLQAAGFETEIIQDGQVALARLTEIRPELVVLDLHLPNITGEQILHEIRTNTKLAEIKVIIVSADPRMAEQLRAEANLILLKPISFSQLRDLAARLRPPDVSN